MNPKSMLKRKGVPFLRPEADSGPPPKNKKDLGGPLSVIVYTVLIFLFSQFIAAFIAELGLAIFHPNHNPGLDNSIGGQFVYILLAEGLAAYITILIVKRRRLSLSVIGLGRRPVLKDVGRAFLGFVVFYGLLIVLSIIVNAYSPTLTNEKQNLGFTNISNGLQNTLAFISLVIIPPFGEETLVRGYLFGGLRQAWRFWPALAVTSLMFGAAHLELGSGGPLVWAAALDTLVLSAVLCYLREKTGAIYAGILVHMANNLIAFHYAFK